MPAANGRFATTANDCSGSGTAVASARKDLDARVASEACPAAAGSAAGSSSTARTRAPRVQEGARQRAAAGAEVEHERSGREPGVADELVCEGATTKCVATAWPRLR